MKKIVMLFLAAALCIVSCSKSDYVVYENIPAAFYISESGVVTVDDLQTDLTFTVVKGGDAHYTAQVSLVEDTRLIVKHNISNDLNYIPLPAECYSLSASSLSFEEDLDRQQFTITFAQEQIDALEKGNYAVALALESDNAVVNSEKGYVLLLIEK